MSRSPTAPSPMPEQKTWAPAGMRVYTDRDADGKPLIDYSYELSGSSGYGVGCESGEVGRYQTFTFPTDPQWLHH